MADTAFRAVVHQLYSVFSELLPLVAAQLLNYEASLKTFILPGLFIDENCSAEQEVQNYLSQIIREPCFAEDTYNTLKLGLAQSFLI